MLVLKNAFDTFDVEKKGSIGTVMIGTILSMLGIQTTDKMLQEIINEVDADGKCVQMCQLTEYMLHNISEINFLKIDDL